MYTQVSINSVHNCSGYMWAKRREVHLSHKNTQSENEHNEESFSRLEALDAWHCGRFFNPHRSHYRCLRLVPSWRVFLP